MATTGADGADGMTPVTGQSPAGRSVRVLQSVGALIITFLVLILVFGIPARLLFGIFFD